MYTYLYLSPIGNILLKSDGKHLTSLTFSSMKALTPKHTDLPVFMHSIKWLDNYFSAQSYPLPALKLHGTPFQMQVWQILQQLPRNTLITYGEIAKQIAKINNKKTMSAQAVGGAVGRNPISIMIPCHRVIGANNSLTGYSGGIDKKVQLLQIENFDTTKYTMP